MIAAVQILDDVEAAATEPPEACVKCRNDVVRTVRTVVDDDVKLCAPQHVVERDPVTGIADPDRNVGFRHKAGAGRIYIDPDDGRAARKILRPDLERTAILYANFEQADGPFSFNEPVKNRLIS